MKYVCDYCGKSFKEVKSCSDCETKCKAEKVKVEEKKSMDNILKLKTDYLTAVEAHNKKYGYPVTGVTNSFTTAKSNINDSDLKEFLSLFGLK